MSEGPGCGATFPIALPALSMGERQTSITPDDEVTDLRDARVLVVDDDRETLDMLRDGLAQYGAIVVTAASVDEARGLLVTEIPDVIVSDLAMPEEDGFSFISDLRARRIDTPAIALPPHPPTQHRPPRLPLRFH